MKPLLCALLAFFASNIFSVLLGFSTNMALAAANWASANLTAAATVYAFINFAAWLAGTLIATSTFKSANRAQTTLILIGLVLVSFAYRSATAFLVYTDELRSFMLNGIVIVAASIGGILAGARRPRAQS